MFNAALYLLAACVSTKTNLSEDVLLPPLNIQSSFLVLGIPYLIVFLLEIDSSFCMVSAPDFTRTSLNDPLDFVSVSLSSVDLLKPGTTAVLRNAKIDMFKGSMRLAVDKWGRIEVTEPATFDVKEDNNLSLVEYELVNVVDE
ncbi:UNVERIFIED_CONTAM: hypothetical protein Slati_3991200 [Sesamum latifolium]|uniref:Single-stranded DNA binding protein Ssb-like OB fold domain-containing protein n=1 Tax=Sesamum latifolium TaxID=2727402 RepID=A0AAW2TR84_9LAMI